MARITSDEVTVKQNNTYVITFNLVDEALDPITLPVLGTFVCSQYYYNARQTKSDKHHLDIINGRDAQDVLNANNVVVTTNGTVTWTVQAEDTAKLNSKLDEEVHITMFQWHWNGNRNNYEITFNVQSVPKST